jgi:hypothetical protein
MQNPTGQAEAPIPPETVSNDSDINRTDTNSRKAAKRTLPWDLNAGELLVEDNPVRKNPRLEDPLPTTTDEAARMTFRKVFLLLPVMMMMQMQIP